MYEQKKMKWTPYNSNKITRIDNSSFSVENTLKNQEFFKEGVAIRFEISGTFYYAIITSYSSGTVTLSNDLFTAQPTLFQFDFFANRVISFEIELNGVVGETTSTSLIEDINGNNEYYTLGKSFLAGIYHQIEQDDSGATQPTINLLLNGNRALSTAFPVSETISQVTTGYNSANLEINLYEPIEIECQTAGTNGDAFHLTIKILLVLE